MEDTTIDIRPAGIDDLAAVFHLGERLFTSQQYSNLYRTWDQYEVTGQFNLEPDNFLIAEQNEQVVGFAIGSVIEKARSAWTYGHLVWLGIDPDVSRQGIATRLFDRFVEIMQDQGVRMLLVDTQANNEPALAFFREKGFGNPVEHVYLTLNLDSIRTSKE
ncbi:GNAT family N-acetyltransferase [Spirochaeta africana]|uniref:Acetyltransferase n=1 Tax=Spirochaeta africana (strain ATCC 700263 / DSM 8902 / Z-7692) TaxID=889378 RepID=H9UM10_SPIAZ|nr:GNAT family N-acetyltransferase [Spirochaeta africana]AFG38553.1 acetyltransferase [Spirochaeta africana DSM 8902]